jgi:long-subunit fatty acid transport protein
MTHELSSNGFGFGARFRLGQKLDLDLGGLYAAYSEADKTINYGIFGSYKEKYQRSTLAFAIGLGYHFN